MKLVIGSDHAGFELKNLVRENLIAAGHELIDVGAFNDEPSDYPDFAELVGQAIRRGEAPRGILDLRFWRGCVRGGQQDTGHSRGRLSRYLFGSPGCRARRYERAGVGSATYRVGACI